MASISFCTYGLNEETNIKQFVEKAENYLQKITDDYEIIFLDDGSTDKSLEILNIVKQENKNFFYFKNEKNMNIGYCFNKVINLAKKDYVLIQMADWSYDVDSFLPYFDKLKSKETDVLHGFRSLNFFKRSDNIYKSLVSFVNLLLIGTLYGFVTKDFQGTYFFERKKTEGVNLKSRTSFVNPEFFFFLMYNKKLKITEVEMNHIKRTRGIAKGTRFISICKSIKDIFKFWFIWGYKQRFNLFFKK